MPESPPTDWIETALRITGHFEDSADPLGAVSGDFDGMGISLGVLQWNIGSGSLPKLVRPLGRETVVSLMPVHGADLWNACTSDVQQGLAICRGWHSGATLRKPVFAELKAFAHSPPFVEQQVKNAARVARTALALATTYAEADPAYDEVTRALFCWFFDLVTQNGSLKGLTHADVARFIDTNGAARADDVVCDWLAARSDKEAGWRDSRQNAVLWRNTVGEDRLSLLVLSYLRAQKARAQYRGDVLNRKATIALGRGWVHRELHDLTGLLAN